MSFKAGDRVVVQPAYPGQRIRSPVSRTITPPVRATVVAMIMVADFSKSSLIYLHPDTSNVEHRGSGCGFCLWVEGRNVRLLSAVEHLADLA